MLHGKLIEKVQLRIASRPAGSAELSHGDIAALIRQEAGVISDADLLDVLRALRQESHGAGALDSLLELDGITDVLVNGPEEVWIDRGRGVERAEIRFDSEAHIRQLAVRLAVACGRRLDDAQPYVDGRLLRDDGSSIRVHAIIPPISDTGTCLSLRVLRGASASIDALAANGTLDEHSAELVRSIVAQRRSFLIAGGTGSGKTTMLAAMLAEVAPRERIVCIEDTAELRPAHPHVVNLVSRPRNIEGTGEITIADLVKQALRMRPDRIVLGEIRGAEIIDLLTALNTGHEGGAGTLHANSVHEIPARIEALALLGGVGAGAVRTQLSAAISHVLLMRTSGGKRVLSEIATITPETLNLTSVYSRQDYGCQSSVKS